MIRQNRKGFTLIELMIVVAIIGILAAIAVPNFIRWTCKSRQSEAGNTLNQVSKLLKGYYTDENTNTAARNGKPETYTGASFTTIGIKWDGGRRYTYELGTGTGLVQTPEASRFNDAALTGQLGACSAVSGIPTPGVATSQFTANACGNIDSDTVLDGFSLNGNEGAHTQPRKPGGNSQDDCF